MRERLGEFSRRTAVFAVVGLLALGFASRATADDDEKGRDKHIDSRAWRDLADRLDRPAMNRRGDDTRSRDARDDDRDTRDMRRGDGPMRRGPVSDFRRGPMPNRGPAIARRLPTWRGPEWDRRPDFARRGPPPNRGPDFARRGPPPELARRDGFDRGRSAFGENRFADRGPPPRDGGRGFGDRDRGPPPFGRGADRFADRGSRDDRDDINRRLDDLERELRTIVREIGYLRDSRR